MTQMNNQNITPRGLPGEIDQLPLVSRSSAPVRRAAALPIDADRPAFEITDLAWIALKVAHCTGVPVRELRWSFSCEDGPRKARRIFFLVCRELTGATRGRLAWYVCRDESVVEAEMALASDSERRRARNIATALVIERRKALGDRRAAR
jgi:hypothetical protein